MNLYEISDSVDYEQCDYHLRLSELDEKSFIKKLEIEDEESWISNISLSRNLGSITQEEIEVLIKFNLLTLEEEQNKDV